MQTTESSSAVEQESSGLKKVFRCFVALALLLAVAFIVLVWTPPPKPPLQLPLADGRILQIEGVTYGKKHSIGEPAVLYEHFRPWLPNKLRNWLEPKHPKSTITLDRPALVVWVNALDPKGGTNIDCQALQAEFVDSHGQIFGTQTTSWFGGNSFWRVGHVFYVFPRDESELNLQIVPWRTNFPSNIKISNPNPVRAVQWTGKPLPQAKTVDDVELELTQLTVQTNGGKERYWESPITYWEPVWKFRKDGKELGGWTEPEWIAEDPLGNRGKFLGSHQPVLRFLATVYPKADNLLAASAIASLPPINLSQLTTNIWWNTTCTAGTNTILAMGVCPPGVNVFMDGLSVTNSSRMGAVRGGAKSGWTGESWRANPLQVKHKDAHYTPDPTIYIRAPDVKEPERLAVRLKDNDGKYWEAAPETQGSPQGIHPFMLRLPTNITVVVPEIVLLKPMQADFLVNTPNPSSTNP
jgi:hypothetical protein